MPTIKTINGIRICIFTRDHAPAHVHIVSSDNAVHIKLQLDDLTVAKGPAQHPKINAALDWAKDNRDFLVQSWKNIHK